MRLSQLISGLPSTHPTSALDPEVWSVVDDSRKAKPGSLFIARSGAAQDGRTFIADAIARGAVAVLGDAKTQLPEPSRASVALSIADDPALVGALVADRFHGSPTSAVKVIGVTGTNGKTTIAYLLQQILAGSDRRCGLIGTVETDDGARRVPSTLTTPGALELAELFATMAENGCSHAAMEVSSHALHQRRVAAIDFACAIFTNLTGDHLDYHKSMEEYAAAKAILFEGLSADAHAVINSDDPWAHRMRHTAAKTLTCSLHEGDADCRATIRDVELDAMRVKFAGPWGEFAVRLPLVGRHNAINALEAAAAAWTQGVERDALAHALARCQAPPGRLQPVTVMNDSGFSVLVDYAHTDDALLNVLTALRPVLPEGGALRVVFGCGGDRDRSKRPRMAAVACKHADQVIITSDNPRTEDPQAIVADIVRGVPEDAKAKVHVEIDRAAAIAWAVAQARPGDIVLIAGKGHEDYQIVGTEKRAFDDRRAAREAILHLRGQVGGRA